SMLVGLGFLTVLSVAFFGGIVAGRHFPRMLPSLGAVTVPKEPRRGIDARLADRARAVEPAPVLTFYHEVTAPPPAPPPAPQTQAGSQQALHHQVRDHKGDAHVRE